MCVRALSCWIQIVSPLASRGHFATIAGRTFVIRKLLLTSLVTLIGLVIGVPFSLFLLLLCAGCFISGIERIIYIDKSIKISEVQHLHKASNSKFAETEIFHSLHVP